MEITKYRIFQSYDLEKIIAASPHQRENLLSSSLSTLANAMPKKKKKPPQVLKGWTIVKVTSIAGNFVDKWGSFGATVVSEKAWKEDPTSAKYAVFKEPAGEDAGEEDYEDVDEVADFRELWEIQRGVDAEADLEVLSFKRFKTIVKKRVENSRLAEEKKKPKGAGGGSRRRY